MKPTHRSPAGSSRIRYVFATAVLACGCESLSTTDKGVLGGGAIGAGTGAIVGNAVGNTGAGALIGAGVGAISGGLIGAGIENSEKKQDAKLAAAQAAAQPPLGLTDVVSLVQQHVSDDVIISQIRTTGSIYHLSPNDIVWLKQNGVSDRLVQEMQATAYRQPRRYYSAVPAYGPPVYVVEPPPPPVRVGFGFGYSHVGGCGRHW